MGGWAVGLLLLWRGVASRVCCGFFLPRVLALLPRQARPTRRHPAHPIRNRERLRIFISGIWPDVDAQLEAGTLKRSAAQHTQPSAAGRPAARRRGSAASGGAEGGSTEAAAAQGRLEEDPEISEDTPLSAMTGDEQQGGEAGAEVGWEPASKRRRASTTVGGLEGAAVAAAVKHEQPGGAGAPGNGAVAAAAQQAPGQQQQLQQQQPQQQQPQQEVQALSVEDAAQMLASAGPELLAALMQQGV